MLQSERQISVNELFHIPEKDFWARSPGFGRYCCLEGTFETRIRPWKTQRSRHQHWRRNTLPGWAGGHVTSGPTFEAEPDVRWVEHPQSHKGTHRGSGRHSHLHTNSRELMLPGKIKIPSDQSVHLKSRTCRCEADLGSADHWGVRVDCGLHGNKVVKQAFMAVFYASSVLQIPDSQHSYLVVVFLLLQVE